MSLEGDQSAAGVVLPVDGSPCRHGNREGSQQEFAHPGVLARQFRQHAAGDLGGGVCVGGLQRRPVVDGRIGRPLPDLGVGPGELTDPIILLRKDVFGSAPLGEHVRPASIGGGHTSQNGHRSFAQHASALGEIAEEYLPGHRICRQMVDGEEQHVATDRVL